MRRSRGEEAKAFAQSRQRTTPRAPLPQSSARRRIPSRGRWSADADVKIAAIGPADRIVRRHRAGTATAAAAANCPAVPRIPDRPMTRRRRDPRGTRSGRACGWSPVDTQGPSDRIQKSKKFENSRGFERKLGRTEGGSARVGEFPVGSIPGPVGSSVPFREVPSEPRQENRTDRQRPDQARSRGRWDSGSRRLAVRGTALAGWLMSPRWGSSRRGLDERVRFGIRAPGVRTRRDATDLGQWTPK